MTMFKIGDYLCRDGDRFSGIIKVLHNDEDYNCHEYIYFGYNDGVQLGKICVNKNNPTKLDDRLLTIQDIEKIPSLDYVRLDIWTKDMKEFLKGAVIWCFMQRELDKS